MNSKVIWNPEDYENNSSNQQQWANEIISNLHFKGNETVLDIGCGDGKNTVQIAQEVPRGIVVGIDNSDKMLALARERYTTNQYPNLLFRHGDATSLNYIEEFDFVVSFACLHWVADHFSVLEGIKNSLKIGGKAYLQFGGKGNGAEIFEIADQMIKSKRWDDFFKGFAFPYAFYHPDEYLPWIEEVGFKKQRVELVAKSAKHNNRESLLGWIRTTWIPYLERIPKVLQDQFLNELVDRYLYNYSPNECGVINVPMIRLEVEVIKEY